MSGSALFTNPALLIIDSQEGVLHTTRWGLSRSNPSFESNLAALVTHFRSRGLPILHVGHRSTDLTSPLHPDNDGGAGIAFIPEATPSPGEPVVYKSVHSAFVGTSLADVIRERGIRTLFVAGMETDLCVSTTIRMGANLEVVVPEDGGRIFIVEDAVANRERGGWDAETVHAVSVASLKDEFAGVVETKEVMQWLT
ncbi:Isochorismatase hydrolase [Lentinus tigrinus ALCF2SS1-7]|uniref:Isochorismatase hydrolase n=1 Tax=Lentinus tigrinus ALCF2SS1-6 TaxID=1328759 RepID=A0A5C2RSU6_9APHY|nr:Isochorismatase hydrolase [Lentinus tigrinus ALCF2SS1-6]RPD69635.1 Isochorismatase hydrolase [Lentinus tigrinus ALCF2SS1-7]